MFSKWLRRIQQTTVSKPIKLLKQSFGIGDEWGCVAGSMKIYRNRKTFNNFIYKTTNCLHRRNEASMWVRGWGALGHTHMSVEKALARSQVACDFIVMSVWLLNGTWMKQYISAESFSTRYIHIGYWQNALYLVRTITCAAWCAVLFLMRVRSIAWLIFKFYFFIFCLMREKANCTMLVRRLPVE